MEDVVVVGVRVVPHPGVVGGTGDPQELLREFHGHILIHGVLAGEAQRDVEEIDRVAGHPPGGIGLLECSDFGRKGRTVEGRDVVEAHESALEEVVLVLVLVVRPPGVVHQQLVQDAREELKVGRTVDEKHLDGRPGMGRRIDVREVPFVGRQLTVRVHVPLTEHQNELRLRERGIDVRHRHTVEGEVPRGEPRVLPGVRHEDDIVGVEVPPLPVAHAPAARRGRRSRGISVEPFVHVEVEVLLGPEQAGERLAQDACLVRVGGRVPERRVEGIGLALAHSADTVEAGGDILRDGRGLSGRRIRVCQPDADDAALARPDHDLVMQGGFRADLRRVDRRIAVDDVVVDPILGVRR